MRKTMQKLAVACIAACAVLGSMETANAQMHDGSHGGGGGVHDGGGSRDGDRFRRGDRFHGRGPFVGPPIILAPGYYPYGYSYPYGYDYPYGDYSGFVYWYCPNPEGYYPDVQACPSGWVQVLPNS